MKTAYGLEVLEVGDLVTIFETDSTLTVFKSHVKDETLKFYLFDLDQNLIYMDRAFNHPTHIFNHLKKHYGTDGFEVTKKQ